MELSTPTRDNLNFDTLPAPPVGGRLQRFAPEWEKVTSDRWVLAVIRHGYRLEFTASPPSLGTPRETTIPREPAKAWALRQEVKALAAKGAVSQLPSPAPDGFYSTFFLTTKKSGEWRPILNLKPLNRSIKPRPFRMETLAAILQALRPGYWGATIDLKDAYMHVPVHSQSRKWLRFQIEGQTFEFKVLPFGLSTSPRVFTRIVKSIPEFLRPKGFTIYVYLDDFLVVSPSRSALISDVAVIRHLLTRLGFLINVKKSNFIPSQTVQFLGAAIDLAAGRVFPTSARISDLLTCASRFQDRKWADAQLFLRLLGLMASLVDVLPWCRLHMRPIQLHLAAYYRPWVHPLNHKVPVSPSLLNSLQWWLNPRVLQVGVPFPTPSPTRTLTTDASKKGWGSHMLHYRLSGVWSPFQSKLHINILELRAVFLSLRRLLHLVRGETVLVRTDNMAVATYLNKQGGTRSPSLCKELIRLLQWCETKEISLIGEHLPGEDNQIADALSRGGVQSSTSKRIRGSSVEWRLRPQVCQAIFHRIDRPHIDLFASKHNHQLPTYYSWDADPLSLGRDALTQDWSGTLAYAFPPIALIPRVLLKLSRTVNCRILLVAPHWPRQMWFSRLLDLLVAEPV